jgi:leucyl aminopeptidase
MSHNGCTFQFVAARRSGPQPDALLVPLAHDPKPSLRVLSQVDAFCQGAVSELVEVGALTDEVGALAHTTRRGTFRRVSVVNIGAESRLTPYRLRQAGASAARWLIQSRTRSAALWIDPLLSSNVAQPVAEWAAGMTLGGFRFHELKKPDPKTIDGARITLRSQTPAHVSRSLEPVRRALTLSEAVNYARGIAHRPPNLLHPGTLAAEGRALARRRGLRCTVVGAPQARRLGMNGLLAVGSGARHAPCLIRLDYRGNPRSRANTVVIGKAVTFDSGGISIKPALGMEKMKFDKCGGTAVLGILRAAADLSLRCNVTGLVAAAENTLSEQAYRPSDILRMMSGKTVEVINTDAEGRLILADALWYAQQHCRPTTMIDLATLTGGVVTALGNACAGLMSNNDTLAAELEEAGRRTHERLWRLPLWDDYRELIKSGDADLRNAAGSRGAHPIVGGMFLKEFVPDDLPWAHLDIAGTATTEDEKTATGFGVALIVDYLQRGEAT